MQVPSFIAKSDEFKAKGIDKVYVYCVNDAAVMKAWGKDQKIEGSIVEFLADPHSALTKALDMEITHAGPKGVFGEVLRCKRFVLVVNDGVVETVAVSEAPDDPAGDNDPSSATTARTMPEAILATL